MEKNHIINLLRSNLATIKAFGVSRIAVFGSVARNTAQASSDVDLLVDFERRTFDSYMSLKEFLEKLVGKKVDLVLRSALKPALRSIILNEAIDVT